MNKNNFFKFLRPILRLILGVFKAQDRAQDFKKIVFGAFGDAHIRFEPYQKGNARFEPYQKGNAQER